MEQTAVDSIGQGRVWSGTDAKQIGLVDSFGGITDAINKAKTLCGLEKCRIVELPEAEDFYTMLLKDLGGEMRLRAIKNELGNVSRYYFEVKELLSAGGVQATLPYYIEMR